MTDTLESPANPSYKAGSSFHYASWPKNTTITLTNIPGFDQEYRDVVMWPTRAAFDTWIDAQSNNYTVQHSSWKRFQDMQLRLSLPLTQAMAFNYVRVQNPVLPLPGDTQRTFYYFVTDVAAVSGNDTQLTLQLDVWQTFIHDITLGLCYIDQGHIGIANENAFDNYGRDYLDMPEGMDVGDEYRIVKTASTEIMNLTDYSVLLCSTIDLTKNPGTQNAPKLTTAPGSSVDGITSGAAFYVFPTPADFMTFMKEYAAFPWITQGITSVTLLPPINRYHGGDALTNVASDVYNAVQLPAGGGVTVVSPPDFTMYKFPSGASQVLTQKLATDWRDTFLNLLPAAYRGLKKFLTSPYSFIELTTFTGSPLIVKPEAWADDDATVQELAVMVPPGQRIAFVPYRYNADPATTPNDVDDNGEFLDFATTLTGFVSVPLVNNSDIGYLAANKNGIAFQFQTADWSQQKAMMGAQATQDVANAEIGNTARQAAAGITARGAQAQLTTETNNNLGVINGALGTVGAGAQGGVQYGESNSKHSSSGVGSSFGGSAGASLNPMSLAGYDATAGIQANATQQGAAIANAAQGSQAISSIKAAGAVRDTNVNLARQVAKGENHNTIAGIQARLRDAKLMQPSVSGQFGGDAMNLVHNQVKLSARFKMVDLATVRRIGNYWLRYGYAVSAFAALPANYQCMSKFTYWKLSQTYVTQSRIPEKYKNAIRGIFEKGVTVWADPSYIGTTALSDNTPLSGISY